MLTMCGCKYVSIFCASLVLITSINHGLCMRIVGGRPAHEGELPYQVGLRRSYSGSHYCGGTLITELYVLTAAHCVCYEFENELKVINPRYTYVVAGQTKLEISNSIIRQVSNVSFHKDYNPETMGNDIALMQLLNPFPIDGNKFIRPVPLNNVSLSSGKCIVSGWGVVKHDQIVANSVLSLVDVQIINFPQCSAMYKLGEIDLVPGMMCAGTFEGGKDACQGDSGGPLVCNGVLVGVVSTGSGCADKLYPGVYSDVAYFKPWIKKTMAEMMLAGYTTVSSILV